MARVQCSVKLGRFKWDRAGYAEVMNAPGVQATLARKARAVKAAAESGLKRPQGCYLKQFQGRLAAGYVVGASSFEARYAQAKDKKLTKALGAAKGGG